MAKRIQLIADGKGLKPHADGGTWTEQYPLLCGYMTDAQFEDGKARKASRLFIDCWKGQWRFTLKEPNQAAELCISVEDPAEGLLALEAMLREPAAPWTVDTWEADRQAKKKK